MSNLEAANVFAVNSLVAVITGGSAGVGPMMAKTLARSGTDKV